MNTKQKKIKCPECKHTMTLVESWDSSLGLGIWFEYVCENCSGIFKVKRGIETDE